MIHILSLATYFVLAHATARGQLEIAGSAVFLQVNTTHTRSTSRGHRADRCSCAFCHHDGSGSVGETMGVSVNEDYPNKDSVPGKSGPFPVVGDAHLRTNSTIMILLSGLADPRCAVTIANVFTRAHHPERMRIGMVDQNDPRSTGYDCVSTYCDVMTSRGFAECPYLDQIQTLRVEANKARGPAWARAGGAQFVRPDEHDFCLQADAHSDFATGFDVLLPRMWAQTGNEYAILSTYVNQVSGQLTKDGRWQALENYEVPTLCGIYGGATHRNTIASAASCLARPLLQRTWGAGLSFAKCHFEARVPNDPYLMGVFDGEEFSRMLRAWTHGYDVYTPHRAVVFHDYGNPRFGTGSWSSTESFGHERIAKLMSGTDDVLASKRPIVNPRVDLGFYGLGHARTVEQFEQFSGLKVRAGGGVSDHDEHCAKLMYAPYAHEPGPSSAAPLPPLDTMIPRNIAKGSEREQWPDRGQPRQSFIQDVQGFVLNEMAESEPGKRRAASFDLMMKELGVAIPAHRQSFDESQSGVISEIGKSPRDDAAHSVVHKHPLSNVE